MRRLSILSLMAAVALVGLGLAAMRDGSELAEQLTFSGVFFVMSVAVLGAVVRRDRAGWVGFAIFAWFYASAVFFTRSSLDLRDRMTTEPFLDAVIERLYDIPSSLPDLPFTVSIQNGVPVKEENGLHIVLTSEEETMFKEHQSSENARFLAIQPQSQSMFRAKEIGHGFLVLCFGILGAIIGHLLAPGTARGGISTTNHVTATSEEPAR
jgi:hypothetical protein